MGLTFSLAVYFIIWWTVLFAVLPIGVRSQEEAGDVVPGSEAAAPERPQMLMKAVITTVIATILFAITWVTVTYRLIDLDALPGGL